MPAKSTEAPKYKYFTADLLSGEILSEIPFSGVSWGRALKSAGTFDGNIPVIPDTRHLDLYDSTAPGVTALYVVRDDVCVWGGIIWTRNYDVVTKSLSVSASEFTSYFYHRKIWKTWNHQFGATVVITGGTGKVAFDYGSNTVVNSGSSVHLEFYEPSNFRYNGYYRVSASPSPTLTNFEVLGGQSVVDVTSVELTSNVAYFYTASNHGFNTGDTITVSGAGAPFDGTFVVTVPAGSESNLFTYDMVAAGVVRQTVAGTAVRPVPDGIYTQVTVTVRADTYDYVRNLIDSAFNDFVGTDFPNVYIEPGISYGLPITNSLLGGGIATLETDGNHNLAVGQAVQVQDLSPLFDGEFEVSATPSDYAFSYVRSGTKASGAVAPNTAIVSLIEVANNSALIKTLTSHGFLVGQYVTIFCGYDVDPSGSVLNGTFQITEVPTGSYFRYDVASPVVIPSTSLTLATTTVGASVKNIASASLTSNVATLATETAHGYSPGNSVTVAGADYVLPIKQKSLDAVASVATITTEDPHNIPVGTSITITGLRDTSALVQKEVTSNKVTFVTSPPHNFAVGDSVRLSGLLDVYNVTNKALTSNVATLTTSTAHNLIVGDVLTVENIYDTKSITQKALTAGVATLTVGSHNYAVNDEIEITNVPENASVTAKEAINGIAVLTLSSTHNFLETQEITVAGVGAPFDGTFTVLSYTDTRILYELADNVNISPAVASGTVASANSIFNGVFNVSAVGATTVSYNLGGNTVSATATSGAVSGWSIFNGIYTVTVVPSSTTVSYARTANNVTSAAVPAPVDEEDLQAVVSTTSRHAGTRVITAMTRNSFTVNQTITNNVAPVAITGTASVSSIFNGTYTVTATTTDTLKFTLAAVSNVLEEASNSLAFVSVPSLFNGTYTIASVPSTTTLTYARTFNNIALRPIYGRGEAVVSPTAIISTFGPFPGNADLELNYSTRKYSGVNVQPTAYRGFELKSLGDALDTYSDSIDGFEYRIDCSYDADQDKFVKTFVLIPINFPNPPAEGEISPISRFGADKLVFEYPGGSISSLSISESAENSATRFFAQGETDLGPDVGPQTAIASADDLLAGQTNGRRWPLLDETEKIDGIDDESVLYAYAKRYLAESRPPEAQLSISVNGSIAPVVGTYAPGDWCSLIVDDEFVLMRLASDLEPRDNVIVRKIDSYRVSVPDGTTFPETVQLNLVPEWEVDKRG